MASTKQSAKQYLNNARKHLIGRLENLSVIVENLYQKDVLGEEQVSDIEAERQDFDKTRKILELVTNQGEAACYELLKIIDVTRKSTLERPLERRGPASSQDSVQFDLHHWISCFPFKATDHQTNYLLGPRSCYRYQEQLKSKAQKICAALSYTPLVLDTHESSSLSKIKWKNKRCKKARPKKMKTYIPLDKQETSPSALLETSKNNILLVGKPAIGKTTVTRQMLNLWSEKDTEKLDYMFYFDMSDTSLIKDPMELQALLFKYCEPTKNKADVLQHIKDNSEDVTIIFDGITDLSSLSVVKNLVEKNLLPDAKIVITCRPEVESEDLLPEQSTLREWSTLRVEVKGFSDKAIREYLTKRLSAEPLNGVLNNLELFSLCHVPMYASMVAACIHFHPLKNEHPCAITEMYVSILRNCIQKHSDKPDSSNRHLNNRITENREKILSLAEVAFGATENKTMNVTTREQSGGVQVAFLGTFLDPISPAEWVPHSAFLHYTMQEFFAALHVLQSRERITGVLQDCLTDEKKHMKHLVPFLCGLLNAKNSNSVECLIPVQQMKTTASWFFREMVNTFLPLQTNQDEDLCELPFLCQCLYESQCTEACLLLLEKLDYRLDLSGEQLDPHCCCAVSYVINQSRERKVILDLEDCTVSDQGSGLLLGCLKNVQSLGADPSMLCHLWTTSLLCEGEMDFISLLDHCRNELHLPAWGDGRAFKRAGEVMKQSPERVNLCLHWDHRTPLSEHLNWTILHCLPRIKNLRFTPPQDQTVIPEEKRKREKTFLLNLCLQASLHQTETIRTTIENLLTLTNTYQYQTEDFLLDLCSHVKDYETQTGRSVLPALQPVYLSASPAVWHIDLSKRKTSLLLEVLKLHPEKKPVKLWGWSDEEIEVRSFLQCLPYISQLCFRKDPSKISDQIKFLVDLLSLAAEDEEEQTGEKTLKLLSSVCSYRTFPLGDWCGDDYTKVYQCAFLLDLYSHVKDYETQTGRSVLPALQPVYLSASPAVWSIDLSERKTSLLLEVLKLQPEKKPVELKGWSDEESEVRSFLQCLPYISQLRFTPPQDQTVIPEEKRKREKTFLLNLCLQAALHQTETIRTTIENLLTLTNTYQYQTRDFLLDLCSHVKDYETQTGRSVLPALQPVYQSASPAVWSIDLSERKASLLLEVLKLQPEKKPVELKGWSDEESEVRSFLQCLPYISQLRFHTYSSKNSDQIKFLVDLLSLAAEREEQTGEKTLKLLSSVCSYRTFPLGDWCGDDYTKVYQCAFLLDLYSHVKDYETQTGRSVLPALQPVYLSASPAVWYIDLSERKTSLLLEVLKLQPEKKPVKLKGWSDEESEVRSFLQCLPYISQLCFRKDPSKISDQIKFLVDLLSLAAEREEQTGEKTLKLLSSVCSYRTFPLWYWDDDDEDDDDDKEYQCAFLLDLYSHVKDYGTITGRSVLPALLPLYQSASPAVWYIDLSERKTSLLLEVLKLQPEKKPVELKGWSDEESEVRSFLQCLPYISQLSCEAGFFQRVCGSVPVRSREEAQQLVPLLHALNFTLVLRGELPRQTCRSVGRVLGLCASRVDLTLTPSKISLKGASLLLTHVAQLHKLRLNETMAVNLSRLVRTGGGAAPVDVEELSLVLERASLSEAALSRVVSSVASLLRLWSVQCLDLTDVSIHPRSLITLLGHRGPLTLRMCSKTKHQLSVVMYEAQDEELTQSFLEKLGGDLTSCSLDWEVLLYLLQQSSQNNPTRMDFRKNKLSEKNISDLLPVMDRLVINRPSTGFVMSAIREIYESRTSDHVSSLMRSLDHVINLNTRELNTLDCAALRFTLQHSQQVRLHLLWASTPPGEIESFLPLLDRVSHLSVDRRLLLRFLHCCAACPDQQGAAAPAALSAELLRALQLRLDLSCSSSVDLSGQQQGETLCLGVGDCRAVSSVLRDGLHTPLLTQQPQLLLQDCEVEDAALGELLPILDVVKLSTSKVLLLQLIKACSTGDSAPRHAGSLCRALGGELDLSETRLDQGDCRALALVLEHSEGLSELDLSHCQLTDQHLELLLTHLHKVQVLDLSHNYITDALTGRILKLVSKNSSIQTVRLFKNMILDRGPFLTDKRFEIW